jgi:hypothetical protein
MDVTLQPAAIDGSRRLALRALRHRAPQRFRPPLPLDRRSVVGSRWTRWAVRLAGRFQADEGQRQQAGAVLLRMTAGRTTVRRHTVHERELGTVVIRPPVRWLPSRAAAAPAAAATAVVRSFPPAMPTITLAASPLLHLQPRIVERPELRPAAAAFVRPSLMSPPRESASGYIPAIVERIIRRGHSSDQSDVPFASSPPVVVPVPRVLSRPTVAAASSATPPVPSGLPPAPLRYWDEQAPNTAKAPQDVELLADQVIRSLDQRVVAARERFGKG